jgi:hypothetical protein
MSVGSCLEETLLHTFEPLGRVASPHTASDLRYIATLKAKHGIDYDCHASYRFVEVGRDAGQRGSRAEETGTASVTLASRGPPHFRVSAAPLPPASDRPVDTASTTGAADPTRSPAGR